jgi:hypothetical protein
MKLKILTNFEAYKSIRKSIPKPSIRFKDKTKYNRQAFKLEAR